MHRPRRLRQSEVWRRMVQETRLTMDAFIYPLFIVPGKGVRDAVESMPSVFQLSVDEIAKEAKRVADLGVPAVLLFAAPDVQGREGQLRDGPERPRAAGHRGHQEGGAEAARVVRRVPVRRHGSRPLRPRDEGWRHRERFFDRNARAGVARLRARGRRCRRAERHDGRPRARHPPAARSQRLQQYARHFVRGEIRVSVLRPVPRSRGVGARVRRPSLVSDGPGERPRSAARSAARSR